MRGKRRVTADLPAPVSKVSTQLSLFDDHQPENRSPHVEVVLVEPEEFTRYLAERYNQKGCAHNDVQTERHHD